MARGFDLVPRNHGIARELRDDGKLGVQELKHAHKRYINRNFKILLAVQPYFKAAVANAVFESGLMPDVLFCPGEQGKADELYPFRHGERGVLILQKSFPPNTT